MNTIQTTKANSTIRRFFSRMGGGGVKALNYKAVNIGNEEGGGTSSEDAEKMYEVLFGQVPYFVAVNPDDDTTQMLPLYELFTALDEGLEITASESYLYYKSDTPVVKADKVNVFSEDSAVSMEFIMGNIFMIEVPEEEGLPGGNTWYAPIGGDVNLIGYSVPTENNPTIVSGKLPTDKNYIIVVESSDGTTTRYEYKDTIHGYWNYSGVENMGYILKQIDDNTIEWSYGTLAN